MSSMNGHFGKIKVSQKWDIYDKKDRESKYKTIIIRKKSMNNVQIELMKILRKHGKISPEIVIEEASNSTHELHTLFDFRYKTDRMRIAKAERLIKEFVPDKDINPHDYEVDEIINRMNSRRDMLRHREVIEKELQLRGI